MQTTTTQTTANSANSAGKGRSITRNTMSDVLMENVKLYVAIRNAYDQCDPEIQEVVDRMVKIWNSEDATLDEKNRAIHTITDAIFPSESVDILDLCRDLARTDVTGRNQEMIEEERVFADRLSAVMADRGTTQEELAAAIGVGQSAISNMLARRSRPQKRTVAKIASALGVDPQELWPIK